MEQGSETTKKNHKQTPCIQKPRASALLVPPEFAYLLNYDLLFSGDAQVARCLHPIVPGLPWAEQSSRTWSLMDALMLLDLFGHLYGFPIANLGILACPLEAAPRTVDGGEKNDASDKGEGKLMERFKHV